MGEAQALASVDEPFVQILDIAPTGSFTLVNPSGDVTVRGGGERVRIEAVKRASGEAEQNTRLYMQSIGIAITTERGAVVVRTTMPERANLQGGVDYLVTVPATVAVTVRVTVGDVRLSQLRGPVEASTVSGSLTASGLGDVRVVTTVSGDVEISDAGGDQVKTGTLSGAVRVSRVTAASIDVEVGNGSIAATDVRASRAYFRTERGDLAYTGPLLRGGLYQLHAGGGSVRFTPQGGTGFSLDATSFRGEIRSTYPFPAASKTSANDGATQTLQSTVGDGSASVTLRSLRGQVTVIGP